MTSNSTEIARAMQRTAVGVMPEIDNVVHKYGGLTLASIRANASGPPGPNRITGDYVRSWELRFFRNLTSSTARLGTASPQGRRLEEGFFEKVDSLGRRFRQRPRPHVRPAVTRWTPGFLQEIRDTARKVAEREAP